MLEKVGVWMVCEYEKVMKRVEFSWLRVGESLIKILAE
jgi:DNA-binding HxlR family transcriptional regulator